MNLIFRPAAQNDEEFLWLMLYHAAHMVDDGITSYHAAKQDPKLIRYVSGWGRESDTGLIALDPESQQPIGAAWLRLLIDDDKTFSYVDDFTPELAFAVLPDYIGKGVGTQLLTQLLALAREKYPAVVLSVRVTNPARHLYERMGFEIIGKGINRSGTESYNMLLRFA